jgi:hypothetical protein
MIQQLWRFTFPKSLAAIVGLFVYWCSTPVMAAPSVARQWNEQLLHAISIDTARPTVHARNLFHLSTAMYDAWSAYDATAAQLIHHEKLSASDLEAARNEAISYAAYNLIKHRFVSGPAGIGPGRNETQIDLDFQMSTLGYDPSVTSTIGNSPAALGNRVAQAVINQTFTDGANETGNYASPPGFASVNPPLTFELPGAPMNDPNRWQPLHFLGNRIDQFGRPINESTQRNLTPFWGQVAAFAMTAADRSANGVYHDQGLPPGLNTPNEAKFKADALVMIRLSAQLDPTDGVMIDVSPVSRGNTPNAPFTESYDHAGYAVNPSTGLPYTPQMVRRGDFDRVISEFWADGPHSTAPPGHWNEIRNYVTDRMEQLNVPKQIGGAGPVVNDLEWDVKSMFALNGGLHDAAIAAWNHKGVYDSSRPISFVRYMGSLGQSSDPAGPSYHPDGLPLEAGLVEVVTAQTTGGVDWILVENWMPYQLISFVTPPFPGYVSGHSTYSRTAAEILTQLTGSEYFPGGMGEFLVEQGSGLNFEYGPMQDMTLQWATYFDASDQASLSRLTGGIHPPADDFSGRRIGHVVGPAAWQLATLYFSGQVVPEPASVLVAFTAALSFVWLRRQRVGR